MPFNFNLKTTQVWQAVKKERFPLFMFAKIIENIFLFLFVVSLMFVGLSIFGFISGIFATKMTVLFLALCLIFWNLDLFVELKIKKQKSNLSLQDVLDNLDSYNLAEFLSFNEAKIINNSISLCKKRKIHINSTALLYSAWLRSFEVAT
jgi:hypothetical protein